MEPHQEDMMRRSLVVKRLPLKDSSPKMIKTFGVPHDVHGRAAAAKVTNESQGLLG